LEKPTITAVFAEEMVKAVLKFAVLTLVKLVWEVPLVFAIGASLRANATTLPTSMTVIHSLMDHLKLAPKFWEL